MDFDTILLLLLFIWLALPLGLIPAVIILAVKNAGLKKLLAGEAEYTAEKTGRIRRERKPLSFTVILIAGVLLIIVAGILFATTTWDYTSGLVKTLLILSLSAVFFAASFISEKKLGLDKTGFAFFILGGLFLPVSVMAIAYFELFGKGFAFEEPESVVSVTLVMLAVTFGVLVLSDFRYKGSVTARYVFASAAAFEYIVFTEAATEAVCGGTEEAGLAAVMLTCGYLLFMIVPSLRTVPAQLSLVSSLFFFSQTDVKGSLAAGVCALVCVCISVVINRGVYSTTSIIACPVLVLNLVYLLTSDAVNQYGGRDNVVFCSWGMGVTAMLSLTAGIALFRNEGFSFFSFVPGRYRDMAENAEAKLRWLERFFALAAAFMAFFMATEEEVTAAALAAVLFFGLKAAVLHKCRRETDRNLALSFICLFSAVFFWRLDPPYIIEFEYYALSSLAATVPLVFIWKNHRVSAEVTVYVHSCIVLGALMINAVEEGEMINAVILTGICALMLVISFMRRAKKWFILSAAALVIIVLQLTSEIWSSVSWWVYLLLTGLIFVCYAAVNEYCRKKGQENPVREGVRNLIETVWKS